jgi:hypothetical protein
MGHSLSDMFGEQFMPSLAAFGTVLRTFQRVCGSSLTSKLLSASPFLEEFLERQTQP